MKPAQNSRHSILREILFDLSKKMPVYVAGGPVRDWLAGLSPADIDLVVPDGAIETAESIAGSLKFPFIPLDRKNGVARVVCNDLILDFSQFREGAKSIEEDLSHRDFTINAMAVPMGSILDLIFEGDKKGIPDIADFLIDPFNGLDDMRGGMIVKAVSRENFTSDPLRLVRAYRFKAQLDGRIEPETLSWIQELSPMIITSSAERISHELEIIMNTEMAAGTFIEMVESRIIFKIIPELIQMEGVEQPAFHHLNVLEHCLETLNSMESLIKKPGLRFPSWEAFSAWLKENPQKVSFLKWSAIFHDIGKPKCKGFKKGRTTFYHHDHKGAEFVEGIASRLRWPVKQMQFVARMVKLHMRPFHLLNDLRAGRLSKRAMRRLALETGDDLPGLFLLAMADSMAGCGPLKPEGLDAELAMLSERIYNFYTKEFKPLKAKKPLLTGHDIQRFFGISPGPLIGKALDALEEARVEGEIKTMEEARAWMGEWLENNY